MSGIEREGYPSRLEAENYLKVLLQRVFHLMMRNRGLQWYNLANRRSAYFYTPEALASGRVEIKYDSPKKNKRKSLWGEFHHNFFWHFAISGRPILFPFLAFNLKTHLAFTTDKYNLIIDKSGEIDTAQMHSFRRKKGRTFFNESWRDLLLAFLHGMAKQKDDPIEICVAPCFVLNFSSFTESYWADFGYIDPGSDRQDILYSDNDLNDECNNDVLEGPQT